MVSCSGVLRRLRLDGVASVSIASCALWSGTNKNRDVSTGPLARLFALTTHSWESEFLMSQNDLVLSHSAAWRPFPSIPAV